MNNYKQTESITLVELLTKLNNGDKISHDDIVRDYQQIQHFIDLLYTIEDFPIDTSDENIYCFTKNERKAFDKYHIQNIANVVIDYETNINYDHKDPSHIIQDYVKNKSHDSKKIDLIVFDYASSKNCSDSKNIKQLILDNATKEKKYSEEVLTKKILEYATDIHYRGDIANIIIAIERHKSFSAEIHDIMKESKLPRRDDAVYQIISSYEPYELTHCISYEMAVRNNEVKAILEKIKILTVHSRDLFKANMLYKDASTLFYVDAIEEQKEALLESLKTLDITLNIDFTSSNVIEIYSAIMNKITEYTVLLEEKYYLVYERKEIIPKGMEEIFTEPNHYEPDIELNNYIDKVIEQNLRGTDKDPNYIDNYVKKDGYAVYQGCYDGSVSYDINKFKPNFKRPMREFNQTQVAFNMSLPKDEIIKYVEKIKDDYDLKQTPYKTLNQLLYGDDTRISDSLDHKQKERYADDFFIYDYYVKSDKDHTEKLESIQKKLSQYHGMKVEKGRNDYEKIEYDKAQIKMNTPKTKSNSNSFSDLSKSFKEHENILHYLAIKVIEERYETIAAAIDKKRYKNLIYDR